MSIGKEFKDILRKDEILEEIKRKLNTEQLLHLGELFGNCYMKGFKDGAKDCLKDLDLR